MRFDEKTIKYKRENKLKKQGNNIYWFRLYLRFFYLVMTVMDQMDLIDMKDDYIVFWSAFQTKDYLLCETLLSFLLLLQMLISLFYVKNLSKFHGVTYSDISIDF